MNALLEFEAIKIDRLKKRWKIFFLVMINDPENPQNKLVTVVPHLPILIFPKNRNVYYFGNEDKDDLNGEDSDTGMFILKMPLPSNRIISASVFMFHSHKSFRNAGEILSKLAEVGDGQIDSIADIVTATALPWVKLGTAATAAIGDVLKNLSDRFLGFASLDEHFTSKYDSGGEIDASRSVGRETLEYSWRVLAD